MTAQQEFSRLTLAQHPLSAAFPAMPDDEVAALSEDIAKHGQREPGTLLDGMVLDGWHRYRACFIAGVQFKAQEFDGDDPVAFVKSKNWHRRHLTASQKAAIEITLHEWRERGEQSAAAADSKTTAEMAKSAGVSPRTIEHAKTAEKVGLGDQVREGRLSAERAASVAKLPKAKREKAVKAIKEGAPVKAPKAKSAAAADSKEIEKLRAKVKELDEGNSNLADTCRELQDKLEALEATEPDEQQKKIMALQKALQRKDGEIERLNARLRDANNKNNELIREVKRLRRAK